MNSTHLSLVPRLLKPPAEEYLNMHFEPEFYFRYHRLDQPHPDHRTWEGVAPAPATFPTLLAPMLVTVSVVLLMAAIY